VPPPPPTQQDSDADACPTCTGKKDKPATRRSGYRPWRQLPMRTFKIDVEHCGKCGGRMKLRALVITADGIRRYLRWLGEPTEPPVLAPARGPPFFQSRAIRRRLGEAVQAELFDAPALTRCCPGARGATRSARAEHKTAGAPAAGGAGRTARCSRAGSAASGVAAVGDRVSSACRATTADQRQCDYRTQDVTRHIPTFRQQGIPGSSGLSGKPSWLIPRRGARAPDRLGAAMTGPPRRVPGPAASSRDILRAVVVPPSCRHRAAIALAYSPASRCSWTLPALAADSWPACCSRLPFFAARSRPGRHPPT